MRWKLSVILLCASLMWGAPAFAQGQESAQEADLNAVDSLSVEEQDDGTVIRIEGSQEATFSVFKLDHPPRLFVDLSNSKLAEEGLSHDLFNGVISTVELIEFEDGFQTVARLVVGFEQAAHYDVGTDENEVVVFIDGEKRHDAEAVAVDEETLEQREAELARAQSRMKQMEQRYESEVQRQEGNYASAREELDQTRQELEQAQSELAQMREQRAEATGDELRQLESAIEDQTEALETAQQEVAQNEAEVDRMRQALTQLEQERDAERARYEEAVARAQRAEEGAESARKQAEQARAEIETLQSRLGEMDSEVDRAESRIEDQRSQLETAQQRAAQLERELRQAQQDGGEGAQTEQTQRQLRERQRELERVQQEADRAEQALARAQQERAEWEDSRQQYRSELAELEEQAQQAEAEKERLSQEIAARDAEIERLETEIDRAATPEEREQLRNEIATRDAEIERLSREIEQAATPKEREQLRDEIATRDAEIERLSREIEQAATPEEREQLRNEIATRDAEIERLQREINEATADPPQARQAQAVPVDPASENSIQAVRLETNERGHSQIVVDLDRPGHFQTGEARGDGRSVMVLNDVQLPQELERTLSDDGSGGVVRFVSSYREDDGSVRMEADLRGDTSEVIRQEGNQVVWEFAPEAAQQAQSDQAGGGVEYASNPMGEEHQPERPTAGDSVTSAPPHYPRVVSDPTSVRRVPGMGTRPITIDLRNADIENVLRLISSESGVNIIAGDDVGGEVTMKLQGVPMDEAFLTILQSLRLGFEIRGNVLRVAPQSVLNEEEQARAEARARAQQTEPLEVFLLPVNYASAGDLTQQVDGLLSPRGSVSVDDRTNTLIIKDLADNLQSIRMLIETLDAQVPQVLIEARIVETNEAFDREFGIQWGGDFSMSQGGGNPTGLVFPNVFGLSGGATDGEAPVEGTSENPNYAVNLPAAAGTGAGGAMGLTMGSVGGTVNLNMRLSAMEAAGYAKIISSPRILTLDNRQATISQGTSIPISVVSAAGVQTIFVDATLELTVTPHVTPDGNVRMSIDATKNEPDFQNTGAQGDPTIIQNQAQTELLVADGDTTVIGGIYTENTGQSISAVPFLHRIPILGFLFRSHSKTENRSELLIFITPRIVNRAEALGVMSTGGLGSQ